MNRGEKDFGISPDERNITIALEAAVGGGSAAVFSGKILIGEWAGEIGVSKSEDVLVEIQKLLNLNKIGLDSIGRIVFSDGAGSLTGLRIGAALAKGLAKSLKCVCRSESVLDALLLKIEDTDELSITAVPVGGNRTAWQIFNLYEDEKVSEPPEKNKQSGLIESAAQLSTISTVNVFFEELEKINFKHLILHRNLFDKPETSRLSNKLGNKTNQARIVDAGVNMAALIGKISFGKISL